MPLFPSEGTDCVSTHNGRDPAGTLGDSGVRLLCGDNLTLLRGMADGTFNAVITDPPYNVRYNYATYKDNLSYKEYKAWCKRWLTECLRVCHGPIAFTPGTKNVGMWYRIAKPRGVLCWHKPAAMGRSIVGACNWEPILVYNDLRNIPGGVDVITAPVITDHTLTADGHPCPKPLEWAKKLLELLTHRGDHILDPFVGSGCVSSACYILGRRCTGIDMDETYIEIAYRRTRQRR